MEQRVEIQDPQEMPIPCLSCLDTGYVSIGYEEDDGEHYYEVPCVRCSREES